MSDVPTRMLRDALRTAPASSVCIDADMLAAWSDGTLGRREREAVVSHASSCARCQALLAAMARTMPPGPPAAERRWWQQRALGWLVPLAAAAAAVVLWINTPTKQLV